tara:strand:- start:40 stop:471 length:432 start_codon:yes stop_codon:yes gene_type:complete
MNKCFECEATEDLQEHHPVPRSRGGTKTVTLCYECHMKAHGRTGKGLNHSRLTKEGLQRAKQNGVNLGTPDWKLCLPNAWEQNKSRANAYALQMEGLIMNDHSQNQMAKILNDAGLKTRRGKKWTHKGIGDLRKRIKKFKEEK